MSQYDNLPTLENIDFLENEEWAPIEGFENYLISNLGRVLSLKSLRTSKILKAAPNTSGYYSVTPMRKDPDTGNAKMFARTIHKLVALHFVPGYEEGLVVNHKNGNKLDNRAENLEWCTQQENCQHYHKYLKN